MIYLILTCVFLAASFAGYHLGVWLDRPRIPAGFRPSIGLVDPKTFQAMKAWGDDPELKQRIQDFGDASTGLVETFRKETEEMVENWGKACDAFRESLAKYGFGPTDEDKE